MATWIVNKFGTPVQIEHALSDGTIEYITVNPTGYQTVLYVTIALYIVALVICLVMVKPTDKALAAKQAKKQGN